jgi:hypothetical protein
VQRYRDAVSPEGVILLGLVKPRGSENRLIGTRKERISLCSFQDTTGPSASSFRRNTYLFRNWVGVVLCIYTGCPSHPLCLALRNTVTAQNHISLHSPRVESYAFTCTYPNSS